MPATDVPSPPSTPVSSRRAGGVSSAKNSHGSAATATSPTAAANHFFFSTPLSSQGAVRVNTSKSSHGSAAAAAPLFASTPVSSKAAARVKTPSFLPLARAVREKPCLPSEEVIEKKALSSTSPTLAESYAARFPRTPTSAASGKTSIQTTPVSSKTRAATSAARAAAAADLTPEDAQLVSPTPAAAYILGTTQSPAAPRPGRSNRSTPMSSPPPLPLSCSECGDQFRFTHLLKSHEKSHKAKPIKWCGLCVAQLSPEEDIINHINDVHIDEEQIIATPRKTANKRCGICFAAVKSLVEMNIHMQTHSLAQKKRGLVM